jgi:hypothetical protein
MSQVFEATRMERNMNRIRAAAAALVVPLALGGVLVLGTGDAQAPPFNVNVKRKVYSAKFMCGEFQPIGVCIQGLVGNICSIDSDCDIGAVAGVCDTREGPVKPGNYQTAINVHNPTQSPIQFTKKAVLLYDRSNPPLPTQFEIPMPPGPEVTAFLNEGWGFEIDCPDIRQVLLGLPPPPGGGPIPFIKGFVEIEVFNVINELDVVAAYTSHGFTGGSFVCSLNGGTCDPANPLDPCLTAGGSCLFAPRVEEGFSTDVEKVQPTVP